MTRAGEELFLGWFLLNRGIGLVGKDIDVEKGVAETARECFDVLHVDWPAGETFLMRVRREFLSQMDGVTCFDDDAANLTEAMLVDVEKIHRVRLVKMGARAGVVAEMIALYASGGYADPATLELEPYMEDAITIV